MSKKRHPAKENRITKIADEIRQSEIQGLGEFYARKKYPPARPNNLNLCVYVREPFTLTGILWWLHWKNYQVQLNMANIYDPCTRNHFLVLASGYANICCVEHSNLREELSDDEIIVDIEHWIKLVRDDDFYKDIINCGFNIEMFRNLAGLNSNDNDFEKKLDTYRKSDINKLK